MICLLFEIQIINSIMGANHYKNPQFIAKYNNLQKQFRNQQPLFLVKDIKFPLSTRGMKIVDATGRRVKIAGGNWSGGHAKRHCVSGIDRRPLRQMIRDIRDRLGMNCIRLTFSLQLFKDNNFIDKQLIKNNPEFYGKTATQIFDQTVRAITEEGLMVFLNNHTSVSQWCCSNSDGDGLWYNEKFTQEDFFKCLVDLTQRYKNNPRVIGMDLRNQIRKSHMGSPTWGDNSKTDWKKAAQTVGNKILSVAPHWLIIVGGLTYQLDLTGVFQHPVKLNIPNKLIYSGHFYSFSWGPDVIWNIMSEEWFREKIFNEQLYVRALDQGIPFLLGQFGNNSRDPGWIYLIKLLKQQDIDWTYWCLDGYKCDDQQQETYGIWDDTYKNLRHPDMMEDLKKISNQSLGNSKK